jgi:hypothetical protein
MDIQLQLKNTLFQLQNNTLSENELVKLINETKETNIFIYYLIILVKYFPLTEFNIVLEDNKANILFVTIGVKYDINNLELDEESFHCLYLMIEPSKIHIENLNKCGNYTGTDMMFRVIHYAQEVKIPKLELTDKSKIFLCDSAINLSYLNILTTGQSWYNSKNFISSKTNEEKENNMLVIQKPFNLLVESIVNNITKPDMFSIVKNLKKLGLVNKNVFELKGLNPVKKEELKVALKDLINRIIPVNNTTTIQEVFQNIQTKFKSFSNSNCNEEQDKLVAIINIIITMLNHNSSYNWDTNFVIKYNYNSLEYTVALSGGKKRYSQSI